MWTWHISVTEAAVFPSCCFFGWAVFGKRTRFQGAACVYLNLNGNWIYSGCTNRPRPSLTSPLISFCLRGRTVTLTCVLLLFWCRDPPKKTNHRRKTHRFVFHTGFSPSTFYLFNTRVQKKRIKANNRVYCQLNVVRAQKAWMDSVL